MELPSSPTATTRLARVRFSAARVVAELAGYFDATDPAELLEAADALEALARQVAHAQVLAAAAIDRDCPAGARA